jgi:undecaprenyl-diphosphatase
MHSFHAVILGIVEGVSEFLPISSTGHLILSARILNIPQTDFVKSFEIIIQLGAILSVIVLYFKTLVKDLRIIKRLCAAFVPTGIIGYLLYKLVKKFLIGNVSVVFWSLLLGGVFIILFELIHREKSDATDDMSCITYPQAILIGLFQVLAIIPGVSRSAATIIGGLICGLKRKTIVEFSFLLAIPTMLAATILDLSKNAASFSSQEFVVLAIGFITSFVVALLAIKFLLAFIQKHSFIAFGVYRVLIALLFLLTMGLS